MSVQILCAQDQMQTADGNLTIYPVLHGSLVLQWKGMDILVDPYGGGKLYEKFEPALVLITDIHGDHFNANTLQELNLKDASLIAPAAVAELMSDELKQKTQVLANGETTSWNAIEIKGIPMYNLPETADSRHPKGRGNGYVLTLGGKKVYISGDTEDIPEMRALTGIDVAFICMNLPYTMDVDQAADAVSEFKPKIVYPFHYRGGGGKFSNTENFKDLVESKTSQVEVRLRNWYGN